MTHTQLTHYDKYKEVIYNYKTNNPEKWKEVNRRAVANYYLKNKEAKLEYLKAYRERKKLEKTLTQTPVSLLC